MNIDNTKNMVILKDLPSNIVEEAIVILKPNIKVKSMDIADGKISKNKDTLNPKKYIVNEAEMIVSNYISNIEQDKKKNFRENKKMENKYKRVRAMSIFFGIMFVLSCIIR